MTGSTASQRLERLSPGTATNPRGALAISARRGLPFSMLLHVLAAVAIVLSPRSADMPDISPPALEMVFEAPPTDQSPQKAEEHPTPRTPEPVLPETPP